MKLIVVDASLAASWLLPDESDERAVRVAHALKTANGVVPRLWHYEMRNLLLVATRRQRLSAEEANAPAVAVTLIVTGVPANTFCDSGWVVMDGGLQTLTVVAALFAGQSPCEVTRHQYDVVAAFREHVCDAIAHRTGSDYADGLDVHDCVLRYGKRESVTDGVGKGRGANRESWLRSE